MTDLLQQLRDVNPAPRGQVTLPDELRQRILQRGAPAPRRRAKHGRVIFGTALALLIASGGATAAVLSLGGEPSKPATGPIPAPRKGQADRYQVSVAPDLTLGANGWCMTVATTAASERATFSANCGRAPKAGSLLVGGGLSSLSEDRALAFYVVDQRVAAAKLHDGRIVRATTAAGLPAGDRLIAATVPARAYRGSENYLGVRLLGADGRPLTSTASDLRSLYSGDRLVAAGGGGRKDAACALAARNDGLVLRDVRALARSALQRASKAAFLTCATATARVDGAGLNIAVLASPSDPAAATALPGAKVSNGIAEATGELSARLIRGAWVVARGGTEAQRRHALSQVRATLRQ